jgi:hypothetical protein
MVHGLRVGFSQLELNSSQVNNPIVIKPKKYGKIRGYMQNHNQDYSWHYLPAKGTAGGILVGFKTALFEVISYPLHDYCVTTVVKKMMALFGS